MIFLPRSNARLSSQPFRYLALIAFLFIVVACGGGGTVTPKPEVLNGPGSYSVEFYVSPSGNDANDGSASQPFKTLEQARAAVRSELTKGLPVKGVAVWLRGGLYERNTTLELTAQDSGSKTVPVAWRGYPGEVVRMVGGRKLDAAWFTLVNSSSPIWNRLDETARGKVLQVDLSEHGISDYGVLLPRGFGRNNKAALELAINGKVQPLARWPDVAQNTPTADMQGNSVQVYGTLTPDVTGTYTKVSTNDGVSAFERTGLVNGKRYRLYRRSATNAGSAYTAWYLTTSAQGSYPSNNDPWWYFYSANFNGMTPNNGATGTALLSDPLSPDRGINHGFTTILSPSSDTTFTMDSDRLSRWVDAPDAWVYGMFAAHWADDHLAISALDVPNRKITLADAPYLAGKPAIVAGQPWYAENLLEEITVPGEWYLDRSSGVLYVWPTENFSSSEITVSMLDASLFTLNGATGIQLSNMSLESTRKNLVTIINGSNNTLKRLRLRNAGATAVVIANGSRHVLSQSHVVDSGEGGVSLSGGNRKTLTPASHIVEDNEFEGFGRFTRMYRPAVVLGGVGHTVRHNRIHNGPSNAILFTGNDHVIEYNDVFDVCRTTSDAGAIYTGRDWGARGNIIRNNFVHDISSIFSGFGVHGIYLDDAVSGIEVSGNVVYKVSGHAIQHGGGRDNIMVNNVLARNGDALAPDTRGYTWWKAGNTSWVQGEMLTNLKALDYQSEPWASRYPAAAAIPNDWAVITANDGNPWLYPQGNVFSRNIGFANRGWITNTAATEWYQEVKDNLPDQDPLFVDEANLDLTLRSDSPALLLPGFKNIPFKSIGLRAAAMPPQY